MKYRIIKIHDHGYIVQSRLFGLLPWAWHDNNFVNTTWDIHKNRLNECPFKTLDQAKDHLRKIKNDYQKNLKRIIIEQVVYEE